MTQLTKKHYSPMEKITFSVGIAAALVLVYGLTQFKTRKLKTSAELQHINYEMAKLKTAESLYSLENREIELDYKALEAKKAAVKAAQDKKAVTDKTKKAVDAKTAAAQQQAALQKAAAQRKAAVKAASKTPRYSVSDERLATQSDIMNKSVNPYVAPYSSAPVATEPTQEDVVRRSFEDWRAEIFSAQNREVILKLTAAYKKGEVSNEVFQQLVNEMLKGDNKMIGLGLFTLRANPSYVSYVKLVKVQRTVSAEYSAYVQEALMAYHQNGLNVLKQALTNPEKAVVVKTLEVIKSGVTTIRSGSGSTLLDPRIRRNDQTAFSLNSYLNFLPVLRNLENSNDQDIVALATANINAIGDGQAVASNN